MAHFRLEYRHSANRRPNGMIPWVDNGNAWSSLEQALESSTIDNWLHCGVDGTSSCRHRIVLVLNNGHHIPVYYLLHLPHPVLEALGIRRRY